VIVGGLGLGYTAQAVLEHAQVGSHLVVDALAEVIERHHRGLLPLGAGWFLATFLQGPLQRRASMPTIQHAATTRSWSISTIRQRVSFIRAMQRSIPSMV
jgi:hypothetical protein